MRTKGFTLIELLVVIVIIGILVAIALPNFIKVKDKAKEAEVKQNLHAIQLAVERYATDQDGNYPLFLYGGEALFNMGVINFYDPGPRTNGAFYWGENLNLAWDQFHLDTDTWDYNDTDWGTIIDRPETLQAAFGDTLAFEGYMPKYPRNPFQTSKKAITFGYAGLGINTSSLGRGSWSCYGGYDGTKMWDLGMGWGELPQIVEFGDDESRGIDLDLPGNFFYHPRYGDGITSSGHLRFQSNTHGYHGADYCDPDAWEPDGHHEPTLDDAPFVSSLDVLGYDLIAVGSPRSHSQDLDTSIHGIYVAGDSTHYFRTGYMTLGQERNPWIVEGGDYPNVSDFDERPYSDSVQDFIIIHLSAGIDKKVGNPTDATS